MYKIFNLLKHFFSHEVFISFHTYLCNFIQSYIFISYNHTFSIHSFIYLFIYLFIYSFIHSFISSQITLYTFYSNISRNNFSFINLQISIEAIYLLCYTDFLIQAYYIYNFFTSAVSSFNVFTAQMSGLFIFPPCQMIYNLSGTT